MLSYRYAADPKSQAWKDVADAYKPGFGMSIVDAIREARVQHGLGIRDAKDLIEAYRDKKYAFAPSNAGPGFTKGAVLAGEQISQQALAAKHDGDPVPSKMGPMGPIDDSAPIGAPYHGNWND